MKIETYFYINTIYNYNSFELKKSKLVQKLLINTNMVVKCMGHHVCCIYVYGLLSN